MAYTTYNSDGSTRSVQTKAQHDTSVQNDIKSGKDTPVGVGGKIDANALVPNPTGKGPVDDRYAGGDPVSGTRIAPPDTPPAPNAPIPPAGTPPSPESTGQLSYEQATANLKSGGLTGAPLAGAQQTLASKYKMGFQNAQNAGATAPDSAGQGYSMVQTHTPVTQPDTTQVDSFISADPGITGLMQGITQLLNPQQQTTSLLDDYKKLQKGSGLDEINQELIDADTVINGTEDDIRNEIQGAGGFGTESQVQAMALSRNKGLIKRYNQLVQMKTDATNQLNTLSQLNAQDKQMAQAKLNTQIETMFKLADFKQQANNNIREAFNGIVAKVGFAGAYQAYASDPRQLGFIEQTVGLQPGGLKNLASQPDIDMQIKQAQLANINSEINSRNNPAPKTQSQAQVIAQGYSQRAMAANSIISKIGSKFTGITAIGGYLPTFAQSADRQAYEQAKREFINSVLRPESGASISPAEFESAAKEYFPQQNDSPTVVYNKAIDRQLKINSLQQQGTNASVPEAGQVVTYNGAQYTVDANGDMTAI